MTPQEVEDLFIRSMDVPMTPVERELFLKGLKADVKLAKYLSSYTRIRDLAKTEPPASFGTYFAGKLIARIQNTGVVIDRQIFSFFKRYQLVAAGVIVALVILNGIFSDQLTLDSVFGLENKTTQTEEIATFDFYKTLNIDL
jgi:hypothetical protein